MPVGQLAIVAGGNSAPRRTHRARGQAYVGQMIHVKGSATTMCTPVRITSAACPIQSDKSILCRLWGRTLQQYTIVVRNVCLIDSICLICLHRLCCTLGLLRATAPALRSPENSETATIP